MTKDSAVTYYGGVQDVADALGLSYQAVWMWPAVIPLPRACQLEVLTKRRLKVDASLYGPITPRARPSRKKVPRTPVVVPMIDVGRSS